MDIIHVDWVKTNLKELDNKTDEKLAKEFDFDFYFFTRGRKILSMGRRIHKDIREEIQKKLLYFDGKTRDYEKIISKGVVLWLGKVKTKINLSGDYLWHMYIAIQLCLDSYMHIGSFLNSKSMRSIKFLPTVLYEFSGCPFLPNQLKMQKDHVIYSPIEVQYILPSMLISRKHSYIGNKREKLRKFYFKTISPSILGYY